MDKNCCNDCVIRTGQLQWSAAEPVRICHRHDSRLEQQSINHSSNNLPAVYQSDIPLICEPQSISNVSSKFINLSIS